VAHTFHIGTSMSDFAKRNWRGREAYCLSPSSLGLQSQSPVVTEGTPFRIMSEARSSQ